MITREHGHRGDGHGSVARVMARGDGHGAWPGAGVMAREHGHSMGTCASRQRVKK